MLMNTENTMSIAGLWQVCLSDGTKASAMLPGTLDENGIGAPDHPQLATRLTRMHVYTGAACYSRRIILPRHEGKRLFLLAERSRELALQVDGRPVPPRTGSLSTPYTFEVTGYADQQEHEINLICDNSYPSGAVDEILNSSAATDETQTNWNGILGTLALVEQPAVFVDQLRLLTHPDHTRVCVTLDANAACEVRLTVRSEALKLPLEATVKLPRGRTDFFMNAELSAEIRCWDEYEGHLYSIEAEIDRHGSWRTSCGARFFSSNEQGRLTINRRVFFLRGEANCAVFPESGHAPMTVAAWEKILGIYASYGVNCMRFHSHCPPDAAFVAADHLGIMMQPELSHWNPKHAFESDESYRLYRNELVEMVKYLGHHPSFVMLSLGNELLCNAQGITRMHLLLAEAHNMDDSRFYAWGSNNFYGEQGADPESDFYTSMAAFQEHLRCTSANMVGQINEHQPSTDYTFDKGVSLIRKDFKGPIFGFEVGQYEVLPDFDEIERFCGVTRASNYAMVRNRAMQKGISEEQWKQFVEATGEMSLACYREEVEAVLRTPGMSGLSLLGLQDFPGQGTALVGMLNSHLQAKPYAFADPNRFAAFFRQTLPIATLQARCFQTNEKPTVGLYIANYGQIDLHDACRWSLSGAETSVDGIISACLCPVGQLTPVGCIQLPLNRWKHSAELLLSIDYGGYHNEYNLWVYPPVTIHRSEQVVVTGDVHDALAQLRQGRHVLLDPAPTEEAIPQSIQSQFTPDFWSVGTFPEQSGAMGCLIDTEHPVFANYPTRAYTTWQWWQMTKGRAIMIPDRLHPIVRVLDSYLYMRSMALMLEVRIGKGVLMLSGMGLHKHLDRIEVCALYNEIVDYLSSENCAPGQEMTEEELLTIFSCQASNTL